MKTTRWLALTGWLLAAAAFAQTVPQPAPVSAFSGKKTPAGIRVIFHDPNASFSIELAGQSIKPVARDRLAWEIDGKSVELTAALLPTPDGGRAASVRRRLDTYAQWDLAQAGGGAPAQTPATLPCPEPQVCIEWVRNAATPQSSRRVLAATTIGPMVVVLSALSPSAAQDGALRAYMQTALATAHPEVPARRPQAAGPSDRSFKGVTLAEGMRMQEMLTGVPQAALLNRDLASPKDAGLPNTLKLPGPSVVEVARFVLGAGIDTVFTVSVFDGRAAHAVNLVGASADRDVIDYWDPWGRGSFLEAANNAAGVAAAAHPTQARTWQIKGGELTKVLYAVTLPRRTIIDTLRLMALLDHGEGVASALREIKEADKNESFVDEKKLLAIAEYLSKRNAREGALRLAAAVADLYPTSAAARASLARAYIAAGKTPPAPMGETARPRSSEVEKSEFFTFFHLAKSDEDGGPPAKTGGRLAVYRPTAPKFHDLVKLVMEIGPNDSVVARKLFISRAFIEDRAVGALAADIVRSHALAAVAAEDRGTVREFVDELFERVPRTIPIPGAMQANARVPRLPSPAFRVYRGLGQRSRRLLHYGEFVVANQSGARGPELLVAIGTPDEKPPSPLPR